MANAGYGGFVYDHATTYTGDPTSLTHTRSYEWSHPSSESIAGLLEAGLCLNFVHEDQPLPWRHFPMMVPDGEGFIDCLTDISGSRCSFHCARRKAVPDEFLATAAPAIIMIPDGATVASPHPRFNRMPHS
jgi:hypothetical protein